MPKKTVKRMKEYKYQIFIPGGNDTALVFGLEPDARRRKEINDAIMKRFPHVEQVGFLSDLDLSHKNERPQLFMAGGEFCGNATRSAAWRYLNGQPGEIYIKSSGVKTPLRAGVSENGEAWAEMPVGHALRDIQEIDQDCFLVRMEGISHIVIMPESALKYISFSGDLKKSAFDILKRHNSLNLPAAGVIFLENTAGGVKIHPCVRVSAIDTMFYETACGSGTVAAGLVLAYLNQTSVCLPLIQPSGHTITADIKQQNMIVIEARISGVIQSDYIIYNGR